MRGKIRFFLIVVQIFEDTFSLWYRDYKKYSRKRRAILKKPQIGDEATYSKVIEHLVLTNYKPTQELHGAR